jgi:hypothetical protein
MLAKHGYLPKILIYNFRISCLYVLHVDLVLPINAHGTLRGRKVALFENQIKQNRVMEYQLIESYQLNQA